ncbi:MAG: hypothetical protein HY680_10040, partial [Chloroflexi bacterium]|nr:hypothetical protein [Chloroflexota bacterium]
MRQIGKYRALRSLVLTLSFAALLLAAPASGILALSGGLLNPGFEEGQLDGPPQHWVVGPPSPAPDAALVVDSEGSSEFATYGDMGGVTVSPYKGVLMLRLGTPKRLAESQNRGDNTVSQSFVAQRDSLKFAFRLFSWEFRGYDLFKFNLTRQDGSPAGTLSQPLEITMPDGAIVRCTALPCQLKVDVGKRGQYLATQWTKVEVLGAPVGQLVTLSYTVSGVKDNAHATWAYIDNANTPPEATVGLDTSSPRTNDTLVATATTFDLDNDPVTLTYVWKRNGAVTKTTPVTSSLTDTYDLSVPGNGDKSDVITVEATPNDGADDGNMASAQATVINTPPVATVGLSTSSPRTNDTLVATATTSDVDNDPVTLTYVWKRNGAATKTTPATSSLVDTYDLSLPGNGDKNDVITVEATPNDSEESGDMASAQATVINTPPVATVGLDTSSPRTNDTLVATATTSDVDNDTVTLTYVWKRNGTVTKTTPATGSLVDTYDLSLPGNGDKGDVITAEATPNDGDEDGGMASARTTVVNTPPVAKFLFTPLDATETTPVGPSLRLEGIVVQLLDRSYDVDPGDAIVSWSWTVQGPNEGPNAGIADQSASSQRPFFIPPDQGSYRVTLTVKDPDLAATTVASGALSGGSVQDGTAADGATVPALIVGNAPPLVNALNIEVLKGDDLPLLGRFLDSGWLDTHTATWEVGNGSSTTGLLAGTVQEDHTPALGTGLVTATLSASNLILAGANPGDILTGFVRVTDNAGDYRDDMFTVTVKAGDAQLRESNDSLSTAPVLTSDSAYLSYIQSLGDVDVFEVKWPGADPNAPQPLPAGAEVLVTLKGLPADYELAVLTQSPSAPSSQVAPFNMTPFVMTPFVMTPFNMTPFNMTPFVMTPFNMTPFNM